MDSYQHQRDLETATRLSWGLKKVKNQTPEICLAAVKKNGLSLRYVNNQTEEMCLAAVEQAGRALIRMENQTPELCLIGVKQNWRVLRFVKEQTPEMCLAAVEKNLKEGKQDREWAYAYECMTNPRAYVKYLEDNNLFTTEALTSDQDYREFLMRNRSKEAV